MQNKQLYCFNEKELSRPYTLTRLSGDEVVILMAAQIQSSPCSFSLDQTDSVDGDTVTSNRSIWAPFMW